VVVTIGLEIYDAAGNLRLDLTRRITTVLGFFDTGLSDGYVDDDRLGNGTPFWTAHSLNNPIPTNQPFIAVNWVGVWRLSWTFPSGSASYQTRIIYGFY
jgi:hypothetical protein